MTLEADPSQGERDKYARLLRYVYLPDGTSFNKIMISEGYAYEYTYNTPYKYQTEYKIAQKAAQNAKTGLWADNACAVVAPADTSTNTATQQPTTSGDKDCKDFKTQKEAQSYFEAGGGSKTYNFNALDSDHDGIACESLP